MNRKKDIFVLDQETRYQLNSRPYQLNNNAPLKNLVTINNKECNKNLPIWQK